MPTDPVEILANNIIRLRRQHGWSQERLAAECGVHRTYIGAIERSERNPSLRTIERIAGALNVTVTQLLSESDD